MLEPWNWDMFWASCGITVIAAVVFTLVYSLCAWAIISYLDWKVKQPGEWSEFDPNDPRD